MWDKIIGVLPEKMVLICTVLSFLIPYGIYKINSKLHEYGDPGWKREDEQKQKQKMKQQSKQKTPALNKSNKQ
ncbi:hypothetical protein [Virgibacillus alimentarius]|uniref:Ion transporter superfamily protein YfcC n=1 Tax=Virgibacillus alimentarius TaxID=698769 RepID=A0ABS4S890_9BACI|nr:MULTISPECIES: hypothetical protein [Virgibacillus]MBP2257711.1 putative ion transporter superfamily protein YfcC [Virgibacillus alimentarius]HLR69295.1 hypothetical protein [Virgibacillus sp.]